MTAIGDVTLVQSLVTGNAVSGRSSGDSVGGGLLVGSKPAETAASEQASTAEAGEPVPLSPMAESSHSVTTVTSTTALNIGAGILNNARALLSVALPAIDGSLTLLQSTVSDNTVRGINAFGGGIALADASARIVCSTISGNLVDAVEVGGGGGVFGSADFINATLHGNSATGNDFAFAGAALLTGTSRILHSTITGNAAPDSEAIYVQSGANTHIGNTILLGNGGAGDIAATGPADIFNLGGNVLSTGAAARIGMTNNVIGATPESVFNRLALMNVAGEQVLTGELADNGGAVRTIALHTMGLARDAGLSLSIADILDLDGDNDRTENLPFDARGEERALSIFTGLAGLADAGAFEAQHPLVRFEGALLDGTETIVLPATATSGTSVFDVAATDVAEAAKMQTSFTASRAAIRMSMVTAPRPSRLIPPAA
ncbi:choice-of-anchor Q domain-containing protein [Antarctobacter sp.]|uniref:choice-of-anchor Q domain-containing protein n=1 Tax=Antarctobacter sp. TaxID=1872577 RepID=UPI003A8F41C3